MRFALGRVVATPGALRHLSVSQLQALVLRHARGDWGLVCVEDAQANERALRDEARLLSTYEVDGVRVWIITEADRSSTCVLLPEEY